MLAFICRYRRTGAYFALISGAPECQALPQTSPKVEYSLTERGHSLVKVLDKLCDWGIENRK